MRHELLGLCLATAILVVPTVTLAAPPAPAEGWDDPLIRAQTSVEYDGAYLIGTLRDFIAALEVEFAGDPKLDHIHQVEGMLEHLGLMDLDQLRYDCSVTDAGFDESCEVSLHPSAAGTPIGRWMNLPGTTSALASGIPADQVLATISVANPGAFLDLSDEFRVADHLAAVPGMGPELGRFSAIEAEYTPKFRALFQGATAFHVIVFNADVTTMQVSAAVVVEYAESAMPFQNAMDSYTERRTLQWYDDSRDSQQQYHVLENNDKIKLPLTWTIDSADRLGILATDQPTAAKVVALPVTQAAESTIYASRLNLDGLNVLVPDWLLDFGLAAASDEMAKNGAGEFNLEYKDLRALPLGEFTITRAAKPNTMSIRAHTDRGLIHVAYKLSERALLQGMIAGIRAEKRDAEDQEMQTNFDELTDALERYFNEFGEYPRTLYGLINKDYMDHFPTNRFGGGRMMPVTFEERRPGTLTYIAIKEGRTVVDFQLVCYGRDTEYLDGIDNEVRHEDGSFIEGEDGYEDLVWLIVRGQYGYATYGEEEGYYAPAWEDMEEDPMYEGDEEM